jgi:hypothetical protein
MPLLYGGSGSGLFGGAGTFGFQVGGTIGGTTFSATYPNSGVETVLYMGGVPFIGLSSGSVAANGVISAITALPAIYPDAYCYFPANALATAIAAGWYYCTFSTTTAGVAFLNTYTSGAATIPASPTAVSDGKGAFLGDTAEEFGPTITVPPLGVGSSVTYQVACTATNNPNAKTLRIRQSGSGGTAFLAPPFTSLARGAFVAMIQNTGSAAKQISSGTSVFGLGGFRERAQVRRADAHTPPGASTRRHSRKKTKPSAGVMCSMKCSE